MIKNKREIKVALTAIVAIAILIGGVNFLKGRALFESNNVFYGVYDKVDGLKVSSRVVYRGYGVGQVRDVQFVGEHFDKVLVEFTVGKDLEIPANTIASIQNADLMGTKAIDLIPGDALHYAQSGDTLKAQFERGMMEQLNEQLEPLKVRTENIMISLDTVLMGLQDIFSENSDGNIRGSLKSMGRTINNAEQASVTLNTMLSEETVRISSILKHINSITGNLESSNSDITRSLDNMTSISDSLRAINLNNSIRTLNSVLIQTDSIMTKVNRGKGTLGGLVNDEELYYNLAVISENMNQLLVEFRQNPKRFVNLSVFDFGGNKVKDTDQYGVVIAESDKRLLSNDSLYLEYPDLKEIRKNGQFLYLLRTYENLRQAEGELEDLKESFKNAYIVKITR